MALSSFGSGWQLTTLRLKERRLDNETRLRHRTTSPTRTKSYTLLVLCLASDAFPHHLTASLEDSEI
jgi:hypothetical protein